MSVTALTTFIKVMDAQGNVKDRYQNAKRDNIGSLTNSDSSKNAAYVKRSGNSISFKSFSDTSNSDYYYLPFIYQGATKNRSGDNLEAALVLANNAVAMNRAREAVTNKWSVEVSVCLMNPTSLTWQRTLTTDNWLASGMSYDTQNIEVILSSAIDAVGAVSPNRVLTTAMVGHLPSSASIRNI